MNLCAAFTYILPVFILLLLPGLAYVPEMIPLTMLNGVILGGDLSQKVSNSLF